MSDLIRCAAPFIFFVSTVECFGREARRATSANAIAGMIGRDQPCNKFDRGCIQECIPALAFAGMSSVAQYCDIVDSDARELSVQASDGEGDRKRAVLAGFGQGLLGSGTEKTISPLNRNLHH